MAVSSKNRQEWDDRITTVHKRVRVYINTVHTYIHETINMANTLYFCIIVTTVDSGYISQITLGIAKHIRPIRTFI